MDNDDDRIPPKTQLPELFKIVDQNKENLIDSLKEPVSIPSISNDPDHTEDILRMLKYCYDKLKALGAFVKLLDGHDKDNPNLPPVLFASLNVDSDFKTVCVYGNIDTASPDISKYAGKNPFELRREGERLYACGVSDNKAPLFCWINALEIFNKSKIQLPVNIRFVIEGSSEMYSKSLLNAIANNTIFFENVEFLCLTIDKKKNEQPCLKYGYRGFCHFSMTIQCGDRRVHSGTYGGAFNQPLLDGVQIVNTLIDKHGKVIIPDFLKDIKDITKRDYDHCIKEHSSIKEIKEKTGLNSLSHKEKETRLQMHKTRLPSLTVNAFHLKGDLADKGDRASTPNKIEIRFSVRLVPNQTATRTYNQFKNYIQQQWEESKSENRYTFKPRIGFNPWLEEPISDHYAAAEEAIKTVFKVKPTYVSEGTSMPVVSIFSGALTGSSIVVMPISGHDDCYHEECESISINGYINGVKLVIAYMCEIHELNFK